MISTIVPPTIRIGVRFRWSHNRSKGNISLRLVIIPRFAAIGRQSNDWTRGLQFSLSQPCWVEQRSVPPGFQVRSVSADAQLQQFVVAPQCIPRRTRAAQFADQVTYRDACPRNRRDQYRF